MSEDFNPGVWFTTYTHDCYDIMKYNGYIQPDSKFRGDTLKREESWGQSTTEGESEATMCVRVQNV